MSQIVEQDQARGVVTLDQCIRSALMDISAGMERYEQLKHWAIEGYREFQFDLSQEIKAKWCDMTPWKSIELPIEAADWVLAGVKVDNALRVFTHDSRLILPVLDEDKDGDPDEFVVESEQFPTDDGTKIWLYPWMPNYYGEDTGQMYGLVAKDNGVGYWKYNPQRREIQLSPFMKTGTKIYLEYIVDGYNPCAETLLSVYAAKLIKLYIHMCRHEFAKSSSAIEKRMARDSYEKEWYRVEKRMLRITVEDVLDAARDAYHLSPYL